VNRELPLDFTKPLPFNDQYIHFGKGQMETALKLRRASLSSGWYWADDKHIPDFVYSSRSNITVTKKNEGIDPKTLGTKGVAILSPRAGERVNTPFRVAMHASKWNVLQRCFA